VNTANIVLRCNIIFKNPIIIYTKVCPARILADNLIAKLKDLIIYENNSIAINIGNNANGASGINILKYKKLS
jgi:hypothetical protein